MKAAPRRPGVGTVPIPGAEALRAGARPGTLSPRSGRHNTTPRPETSEFTASQFGAFRRCAIWAEMLDCYLRILPPPLRSLPRSADSAAVWISGSGKNRSVASGTLGKAGRLTGEGRAHARLHGQRAHTLARKARPPTASHQQRASHISSDALDGSARSVPPRPPRPARRHHPVNHTGTPNSTPARALTRGHPRNPLCRWR